MASEKCLICIVDLKADEIEGNTVPWSQLCHILSSSISDEDTKGEFPLCPHCFEIVKETKDLRCRLEEIRSEVKTKLMILKARMADSVANLNTPSSQYSRLDSMRQSLLVLLDDEDEIPGVEVKLEVQDDDVDSLFEFEDVEETLKDEIDDLNLSNVGSVRPNNPVSSSSETSDDDSDYVKSESESENEVRKTRSSKRGSITLKRKAKSLITSRKHEQRRKKAKVHKTRRTGKSKKKGVEIDESETDPDSSKPKPIPKPFKCSDCPRTYKSTVGLKIHRRTIHNERPGKYACSLCEKSFERRTDRTTHEKIEHKGSFPCVLCKRKFKSVGRLEVHIVTAHETIEKNFSCNLCEKMFTLEVSYNRHIRLHKYEKTKPFVCDICDCRWANGEELSKHHEIRHANKRYACSQCGQTLSSKTGLARHERTHSGEKPFKCDLCEESFIDGVARIWHRQKVHSTIDDHHLCTVCGQKFFSKYILKQHMDRHDGKVYPCDECAESHFKDPDTLKTHKIRVHGAPGYVCDECGTKFTTTKGLKSHKMSHAGEKPHACDLCGAAFLSKWVLANHRRSHTGERPFLCNECGKGFKAKKHLVSHMQGVHSEDFVPSNKHKCSYCGKTYPRNDTLEGHVRQVHTGERPFHCHLCSKAFSIKTSLTLHLKSHGVIQPQGAPRLPRSTRKRANSGAGPSDETKPGPDPTPTHTPSITPPTPASVFNTPHHSNPINSFQHFIDPHPHQQAYPVNPVQPFRGLFQ